MTGHVPSKARWVEGLKGQGKILLDPFGFRMRFKKTDGGKKYYICPRKADLICPVAVTLDTENEMIVRAAHHHNHDSDLVKESVKKAVDKQIEEAVKNRITPRSALMDVTNSILASPTASAGLPYLPKMSTLARNINRKKQTDLDAPPIPRDWSEMELPNNFKKTSDNQDFLIMDHTRTGDDAKIIGFSSPTGLRALSQATDIYCDGTFEFVDQTLFQQVYVFVVQLDNKQYIPAAWYLLPAKDYPTYQLVLENLKAKGVPAPHNFHVDFEAASIKAVKAVYPESNIVGCDAHWKRAIRKKLQKFGLTTNYQEDVSFQTYIRKLWCLSLVPEDEGVCAWEMLEELVPSMEEQDDDDDEARDFNASMEQFLLYFEQTWIGTKKPRTQHRGRPKFEMKTWNKCRQVTDGKEITNNGSGSWNSASKLSMARKPNIWAVLVLIRKEEGLARLKVQTSVEGVGVDSNPGRSQRFEGKKSRLREILAKYWTVDLGEYLDMTAQFYND